MKSYIDQESQPQRNKYCICRFIGVKSFEKVKYSTWAENTLEIQL